MNRRGGVDSMKIPEPYFVDVPIYGDLKMEKVIVEYIYPLLSVLLDNKNKRYICMCFDTRGAQQWLITPIDIIDLVKLLNNKITLDKPFKTPNGKKILAIRNYKTGEETFEQLSADQIPTEDLPAEGEYLDAEAGEWSDYIEVLESEELPYISSVTKTVFVRSLPSIPYANKRGMYIWKKDCGELIRGITLTWGECYA